MSTVSHPMNDKEVFSEMNKMVAFIRQEAMEKTGKSINVTVVENSPLSDSVLGSVHVSTLSDRITVDNTLQACLDLPSSCMLPQLRDTLCCIQLFVS
ncbi:V-ATPase V1 sector subunit E [Coemansia sp. RSA 1199]|nr:V-ATPase V1 sector subunit E [Coemansia sp. RSA 1199]